MVYSHQFPSSACCSACIVHASSSSLSSTPPPPPISISCTMRVQLPSLRHIDTARSLTQYHFTESFINLGRRQVPDAKSNECYFIDAPSIYSHVQLLRLLEQAKVSGYFSMSQPIILNKRKTTLHAMSRRHCCRN